MNPPHLLHSPELDYTFVARLAEQSRGCNQPSGAAALALSLVQGIETVRRDNCQLVRTVVSTCLDRILIEEDIEGAKEYVRNTISDLLMNRLDLSLLVITKVWIPAGSIF